MPDNSTLPVITRLWHLDTLMTTTIHSWTFDDKPALMALCNAVVLSSMKKEGRIYVDADRIWHSSSK